MLYRKRKQRTMNAAYGKTEDEKQGIILPPSPRTPPPAAFSASPSMNEKAPRVSVRPVTEFNPILNPPAASPIVKTGPGASSQGIARKPIPAPLALSKPPPSDLVPTGAATVPPAAPVIPAAQPSPTLSAFSDGFVPGTPIGPVDAAALVAGSKPAPVHRVQMDYFPSARDELEIRIGSLVRLLHEYDDGWVSDLSYPLAFKRVLIMILGPVCAHGPLSIWCLPSYMSLPTPCQTTPKSFSRFSRSKSTASSPTSGEWPPPSGLRLPNLPGSA